MAAMQLARAPSPVVDGLTGNARRSRAQPEVEFLYRKEDGKRWRVPVRCTLMPPQSPAAAERTIKKPPVSDFVKAAPENRPNLSQLLAPVSDELLDLNNNLKSIVGARDPVLMSAAEQIFGAGGKRLRPALVLLVAQAANVIVGETEMRPKQRQLAAITEMIHTASLIHDDVLDASSTRRGQATVHQLFGTRVAVLAGDYLFAQSSWGLAQLDNLEVIKLISKVIADFATGEIQQASSLFNTELSMEEYEEKSFFKTASLIAASTKSAAIFSDAPASVCAACYDYGKHLGLAFQVVDDILDFTQTSEQLGKPAGSDLASGNLTAPTLFALRHPVHGAPLRELIQSQFAGEGGQEKALLLVKEANGIEMAKDMAKEEARKSKDCLEVLPESEARRSLEGMVDYVLDRLF